MATAINQTNAIRQSYQPVTVSSYTRITGPLCAARARARTTCTFPSGGLVVRVSVGTQNPLPGVRQTAKPDRLREEAVGPVTST